MLATGGVILTAAGSLLISRSLELVKPIEFTHMKIGTGDISSIAQARKLNDLVASYKNINMSTLVRSGDLVRVRGSFTNDEITETVRIKEVGVFAKIGTEQPILFGYVNDGEGELIPPGTSGVIARTRDLYIGVTGEAEVAITINKSLVYATIEDLEEGLNRKEDKCIKKSGWNLDKTDLTENDSNKLFTAKGALNLFNTLTTNFTNGINAAKEVLRLDIVKKLNKGAYLGDAQDLKNDIDSKEPIIDKKSGFNKIKTDLVENDTNKVFSAKGAFDLKTWLITNYTTLMNNIRDTLTNMINLKLPHGGYGGTGQELKNDIDTKANKAGDTFTGPLKVHSTLSLLIGNVLSFNSENGGIGWGVWERQNDGSLVFATRSGVGDYSEVLKIQANNHLISQGEFYALGGHKVYHPLNKPTPEALGLGNVNNTADSTKEVLSATKLKTPRTINGTDFDGSKPITTASWGSTRTFTIGKQSRTVNGSGDVNWPLRDIGAIDRNGDTISSRLNMSLYGGQLGFGVGEGANFRMYADIYGNFNINSYRDNSDTIRIQGFRMNHESGEITIDNGSLPLIETIRKQRTDLDFLGANKLDRTNGTYNGFLNFPLDGHGITFNNGSGLGYKIYEHGSSGGLRFEVTTNGAPSGQFAYLNGGANGKILTDKDCPYPVGGIYITSSSTNPATIWPGTTWNRILGKVIVGVDEGQGEFNIVNKEGGSKYHTLSINEIPSHNHPVRRSNANGGGGLGTVGGNDSPDSWNPSGYTGGGQAHNNLQPYVTKYIWERTR